MRGGRQHALARHDCILPGAWTKTINEGEVMPSSMEKLEKIGDLVKHLDGPGAFLFTKRQSDNNRIHATSCQSVKSRYDANLVQDAPLNAGHGRNEYFWCETLEEAKKVWLKGRTSPKNQTCRKCKMPPLTDDEIQAARPSA